MKLKETNKNRNSSQLYLNSKYGDHKYFYCTREDEKVFTCIPNSEN